MGARSSNTNRKGHRSQSLNRLFDGHEANFFNSNLNAGTLGPNQSPASLQASGGTTSEPGDGYKYHLYLTSSTFVVTAGPGPIEYILVGAGGGGGGHAGGGGGGAGGVRTNIPTHTLNSGEYTAVEGTYTVTIGSGGAGATSSGDPPTGTPNVGNPGTTGGHTELYLPTASYPSTTFVRAAGGGGGGGGNPGPTTVPTTSLGGSGGGGAAFTPHANGDAITDPNWPVAQGNPGGDGNPSNLTGGGGGGAGGNGTNAPGSPPQWAGVGGYGAGFTLDELGGPTLAPTLGADGPPTGAGLSYAPGGRFFAGGGGGGNHNSGNGGAGGGRFPAPTATVSWAGGAYGTPSGDAGTTAGTNNTGGGGSGAGGQNGAYAAAGGAGGPGFALIRYPA